MGPRQEEMQCLTSNSGENVNITRADKSVDSATPENANKVFGSIRNSAICFVAVVQ